MSDSAPDTPTSTRNTRSKKVPFASLLDDGPEDFADYDWTDDTFAAYTRTTLDKNGDDVIVTFKLGDFVLARSNDGNRPSLAVISKLMGYNVVGMDNLITGSLKNIEHLFKEAQFEFYNQDVSKYVHVAFPLPRH